MVQVTGGFIAGMVVLAVFTGYVLTSLLLFRFPTLIHRKKNSRIKCKNIAHRGGMSTACVQDIIK